VPTVTRLVLPVVGGDPTLRPVGPGDEALLLAIYASTRAAELDLVEWPPGERERFERAQHLAQQRDYAARFPGARHDVVEVGGRAVGRIFVHTDADRVLIVDVSLLPSARGLGIGGGVLREVISRADGAGLPVRLQVEPTNRARRLYVRLGFEVVGRVSTHLQMEHPPRDGAGR